MSTTSGWCLDSEHANCRWKPCTCHCHTAAAPVEPVVHARTKRRVILDKMVQDAQDAGAYDTPENEPPLEIGA